MCAVFGVDLGNACLKLHARDMFVDVRTHGGPVMRPCSAPLGHFWKSLTKPGDTCENKLGGADPLRCSGYQLLHTTARVTLVSQIVPRASHSQLR